MGNAASGCLPGKENKKKKKGSKSEAPTSRSVGKEQVPTPKKLPASRLEPFENNNNSSGEGPPAKKGGMPAKAPPMAKAPPRKVAAPPYKAALPPTKPAPSQTAAAPLKEQPAVKPKKKAKKAKDKEDKSDKKPVKKAQKAEAEEKKPAKKVKKDKKDKAAKPKKATNTTPKSGDDDNRKPTITRRPKDKKPIKSAAGNNRKPKPSGDVDDEFAEADLRNFKITEFNFDGSASVESIGTKENKKGNILKGIEDFKAHPIKYTAIQYQTSMTDWPSDQQQYTLIHRKGTVNLKPQNVSPSGWMTILMQDYEALPRFPDNKLPKCDKYTDNTLSTHQGRRLPPAVMPGRGQGVVDAPNIKVIGDIDPSDIHQGSVGDCWLLSGISSLAEFDGAIKKLFRKTKKFNKRPLDTPNMYTVTLWDLSTWTEVDIVIDERLCAHPTLKGQLLASKPSEDGELWVCYLEKALAAHCGGWDKITGGQCTHAWALMTGCREQYTIKKNKKTGKYQCSSKFNPNTGEWARHANSPHDAPASVWPGKWPDVGGGGTDELTQEEVFMRLCAWDDVNFIMGAGRGSSQKKEAGMVDNHGYSVIECRNDVAGTDIDLIKVRNPWGKGEIENGYFDDDGPGWDEYPQIKKELNPVVADDGIFWVTKQEFFDLYDTIYVSASNMTEFLED